MAKKPTRKKVGKKAPRKKVGKKSPRKKVGKKSPRKKVGKKAPRKKVGKKSPRTKIQWGERKPPAGRTLLPRDHDDTSEAAAEKARRTDTSAAWAEFRAKWGRQ